MIEMLIKSTVLGLEMVALTTIVIGFGASVVNLALSGSANLRNGRYVPFRRSLARSTLVALEILIAADILRSIVLEPSMMTLAVLAVLVGIRTFLSFSIDVELDGCWPWKRAELRVRTKPEDDRSSASLESP